MQRTAKKLSLSYSRISKLFECYGIWHFLYEDPPKIEIKYKTYTITIFGQAIGQMLADALEFNKLKEVSFENLYLKYGTLFEAYFHTEVSKIPPTTTLINNKNVFYDNVKIGNTVFSLMLKHTLDFAERYKLKLHSTERSLKNEESNIVLRGRYDALFESDTGFTLVDFKCTKKPEKYQVQDITKDSLQFSIYRYLLHAIFKKPVERIAYIVADFNGQKVFDKTYEYSKNELHDFSSYHNSISEFYKQFQLKEYKPNKEKCGWCDFKQICPHSAAKN